MTRVTSTSSSLFKLPEESRSSDASNEFSVSALLLDLKNHLLEKKEEYDKARFKFATRYTDKCDSFATIKKVAAQYQENHFDIKTGYRLENTLEAVRDFYVRLDGNYSGFSKICIIHLKRLNVKIRNDIKRNNAKKLLAVELAVRSGARHK